MNVPYLITNAEISHISVIARDMRESDKKELWHGWGKRPDEALYFSFGNSLRCWTVFVDGMPSGMWGVAVSGIKPETGMPWLLATDRMQKVERAFARVSRMFVEKMQTGFSVLENMVHAENETSLRWLRWCGFEIDDIPFLISGERFYMFRRYACAG